MAVVNNTTVVLNDYPIMFDGAAVPFPSTWRQTKNKVTTSLQSEGGTDLIQAIRKDKLHIDASFRVVNDNWVKFFAQFDARDSFTLKQYSPLTSNYEERTVRLENFSYNHVRKSEKLTQVTGVWEISFSLEEF